MLTTALQRTGVGGDKPLQADLIAGHLPASPGHSLRRGGEREQRMTSYTSSPTHKSPFPSAAPRHGIRRKRGNLGYGETAMKRALNFAGTFS